jgi:LemA protein
MGTTTIILLVIGAGVVLFLIVVALALVGIYNGLVNQRVATENAWAQIDVQLKRRYDLLPNLVETVKGYASHEKETLEKVIQARNMAMGATSRGQVVEAENMLSGALKTLFAVSEAYPDLKANQNFMDLQEELKATENRIGFSRQFYNDVVGRYNATLQRFPTNIVGNMFGFRQVEFFNLGAEAAEVRQAPKVKF